MSHEEKARRLGVPIVPPLPPREPFQPFDFMGYVCSSPRCPTGLGSPQCVAWTHTSEQPVPYVQPKLDPASFEDTVVGDGKPETLQTVAGETVDLREPWRVRR